MLGFKYEKKNAICYFKNSYACKLPKIIKSIKVAQLKYDPLIRVFKYILTKNSSHPL